MLHETVVFSDSFQVLKKMMFENIPPSTYYNFASKLHEI